MIIMKSKRRAVLTAPCILSPGLQAAAKAGGHWGYPFVELLMNYEINVVQLPCPEATFGGYQRGLQRGKHGINYYQSLYGYEAHCSKLTSDTINMILDMQKGGICFICALGVEHSPTCAVSYMYSKAGMQKRAGLFAGMLKAGLELEGIQIPWIGINRTYYRKALSRLEQMLLSTEDFKRGEFYGQ